MDVQAVPKILRCFPVSLNVDKFTHFQRCYSLFHFFTICVFFVKRINFTDCLFYYFRQIFVGNDNQYTVVGHNLKEPIVARYIRIHPVTWHGLISMRAEMYGCSGGNKENTRNLY